VFLVDNDVVDLKYWTIDGVQVMNVTSGIPLLTAGFSTFGTATGIQEYG